MLVASLAFIFNEADLPERALFRGAGKQLGHEKHREDDSRQLFHGSSIFIKFFVGFNRNEGFHEL